MVQKSLELLLGFYEYFKSFRGFSNYFWTMQFLRTNNPFKMVLRFKRDFTNYKNSWIMTYSTIFLTCKMTTHFHTIKTHDILDIFFKNSPYWKNFEKTFFSEDLKSCQVCHDFLLNSRFLLKTIQNLIIFNLFFAIYFSFISYLFKHTHTHIHLSYTQ